MIEIIKRFQNRTEDYSAYTHTALLMLCDELLQEKVKEIREDIENRRKPTHERNYSIPLRGTMVYERNYNSAIENILTLPSLALPDETKSHE